MEPAEVIDRIVEFVDENAGDLVPEG